MMDGDYSRGSQRAGDHKEDDEIRSMYETKQKYDAFVCAERVCLEYVNERSGKVSLVFLENPMIKINKELDCVLKQTQESLAATVQMEKVKQNFLKEELQRAKDAYFKQCMGYTTDLRNAQNLIDNLRNECERLQNANKTLAEINANLKVAKVEEEKGPETRKTPSVWKRVRHFLGLRKPQRWKKKKECSECNTPLSSDYYDRDGQLFCHEDYWAKYGYLCHGCDQTITTSLLTVAEGHKYHPGCFTCLKCQTAIGDGDAYALVEESKLLCGHCYCQSISTPEYQPNSSDTVEPSL